MKKTIIMPYVITMALFFTTGITTLIGMQEQPQEVFGSASDAAQGRMDFGVAVPTKISSLTGRSTINSDKFVQLADYYAATLTNAEHQRENSLHSVFILAGPVFYQETPTKRKEYTTGQEALVKILFKDMSLFLLENRYARALLKKKENCDTFVQLLVSRVQAPCKQIVTDAQETLGQYLCQECTLGKRSFSLKMPANAREEQNTCRDGICVKTLKGLVKWVGVPALVAHGFALGQATKHPAAYIPSFIGAYIVSTAGMFAVHLPFWLARTIDSRIDL